MWQKVPSRGNLWSFKAAGLRSVGEEPGAALLMSQAGRLTMTAYSGESSDGLASSCFS